MDQVAGRQRRLASPHRRHVVQPRNRACNPRTFGRASTEPTTVYVENITGALYLDKPAEVAAYEHVWSDLETLAASEAESEKLIQMIIEERS